MSASCITFAIGRTAGAPRRPNQHDYCTHTPDGRYPIDVACFDPPSWDAVGHLDAWVEVIPARAREYRIAPRDARVASVRVAVGQAFERDALLIEFEDLPAAQPTTNPT